MPFAQHPYFDESGGNWFEFPLTEDGTPAGSGDSPASQTVTRDFERITDLVLNRLKSSIPADWLTECPFPILNQLLFHPTDVGGTKVFLEYMFLPNPTENSPHSDSWWAIAICPYPNGHPYTGRIEYVVVHFGWTADWRA